MSRFAGIRFAVASSLLLGLGGALPLSAQLGARPADEWALTLESGRRLESLDIQRVVAMVGLKPGDVVADIGAGTGIFSIPMAQIVGPSGAVLSVEVDPGFLPMIEEKADSAGLENVQTVLGEFGDPKLPRTDVTVAFFHDVLHHISERQAYLQTLAGYMAPGSRIIVVDYDMHVPGVPHSDDPTLLIGPEQVEEWMGNAGFELTAEYPLFQDKFFVVYTKTD
jgi:predicted methyltransferase